MPDETDPDNFSVAQRIANIPCAKDSLIYGISGMIFGYLTTFAFTSNGRKASKYSQFCFLGISVPYLRPVDRSKSALKEILDLPGVKKPTEKVETK